MGSMEKHTFPVVDISYITTNYSTDHMDVKEFSTDEEVVRLSQEFVLLLSQQGFIYVRGGSFKDADFERMRNEAKDFFELPLETKMKSQLPVSNTSNKSDKVLGYIPPKMETFDSRRPPDMKEAFDYISWFENVKFDYHFFSLLQHTFNELKCTMNVLLYMCAIGLGMNDASFFVEQHQQMGKPDNSSNMRNTFYPEIDENVTEDDLIGQQRIGEHSDFGFLTLLFQDQTGGLQARNPSGEFVEVVPLCDTFVVNCGMMLERMSGGIMKATKHRVVISSRKMRQSLAFFSKPDVDVLIEPFMGDRRRYQQVFTAIEFDEHYQKRVIDGETRDHLNMEESCLEEY